MPAQSRTRSPASPSPRRASPRLPSAARLAQLKLSREVAWYLLSRGIPLPQPWQVPRWKTPEPGELLDNAVFDPARVDRVLLSFGLLVHTQGRWAGRPLKPDPWQVGSFLVPLFVWGRFAIRASFCVVVFRTE